MCSMAVKGNIPTYPIGYPDWPSKREARDDRVSVHDRKVKRRAIALVEDERGCICDCLVAYLNSDSLATRSLQTLGKPCIPVLRF